MVAASPRVLTPAFSEPSMERVSAKLAAVEDRLTTRLEMLEQRADLLEKIFLFVDIDVLNKAITLALDDFGSAGKASSYLGASLLNAALGLVHRKLLGSHRVVPSGKSQQTEDAIHADQACIRAPSISPENREHSSDSVAPMPTDDRENSSLAEEALEGAGPELSLVDAAEAGRIHLVAEMLSGRADHAATNDELEAALHKAAYRAHKNIVELLLAAHANPNACDRKGKTPIRKAYDDADIVAALLKARADPNATDEAGRTTLHRSAETGHVDVIEVLIQAGADANVTNIEGETPVHEASNFGQVKALQTLILGRGNVDAQDAYGSTPLHFAAYGNHVNIAQLLIEFKANVATANTDGETPLQIAEEGEMMGMATLLRECMAPAQTQ
eukprot:TRINITY_DN31894_c0_g1_i1.p1 TRINITY_DN31894_c0_g1~~TRINITY_DN31894_c0_g1_i1.p1  ORF type:complete len:387 (+),score=77.20 TRINITY_DN31894_c0_g1_i1:70-1230(+)